LKKRTLPGAVSNIHFFHEEYNRGIVGDRSIYRKKLVPPDLKKKKTTIKYNKGKGKEVGLVIK
jgi:hypothetical protein